MYPYSLSAFLTKEVTLLDKARDSQTCGPVTALVNEQVRVDQKDV